MAKPDKKKSKTVSLLDEGKPSKKKKKLKPSKKKKASGLLDDGEVVKRKKKKKKKKEVDLGAVADSALELLDNEEVEEEEELEEEIGEEDDSDIADADEESEDEEEEESDEEETEEEESSASDESSEESEDGEEEEEESEEEEEELTTDEADASRDALGIRVVVELYKERCTNCVHLVSHAKKRYDGCHYLNGNERCPAQNTYMIRSLPIQETAQKLVQAKLSGDILREQKIRDRLREEYDPLVGRRVSDAELALLQEHFLRQAGVSLATDSIDPGPTPEGAVDASDGALDEANVGTAEEVVVEPAVAEASATDAVVTDPPAKVAEASEVVQPPKPVVKKAAKTVSKASKKPDAAAPAKEASAEASKIDAPPPGTDTGDI